MGNSTPAAEAGSTEETVSEEDAAENSTDTEEEASPALALRMLAVSADAAAGTLEENGTADEKKVTINYDDSTSIHSVDVNGERMIVFCMNKDLHWPHNTPSFNAPYQDYRLVETQLDSKQEEQLATLIYAGYPYNGLSLFQIVKQAEPLSEDDFDKLLIPPAWIRSDFPDLGETQFTYKNVAPGSENATKLDNYLDDAGKYLNGKKTHPGAVIQKFRQQLSGERLM